MRLGTLILLVLAACSGGTGHGLPPPLAALAGGDGGQDFPVPRPPFSEGIFPCSQCHLGGPAPAPPARPAFPHAAHLARDLECADCHGEDADPKLPEAGTCFDCHETLAEEPQAVQDYFAAVRAEDGSYRFQSSWKTKDTVPAHKRHAAAGVACAECHGDPPAPKPRSVPLMERCQACHTSRGAPTECRFCHQQIRERQHRNIVLHHAEEQRGCLDCHNPTDRDTLRLANGDSVRFEESYRLCGQCHGPKLRDWKAGLHGKRTGMWDGPKSYLLCVHCHSPHDPAFKPIEPMPPPLRPEEIR